MPDSTLVWIIAGLFLVAGFFVLASKKSSGSRKAGDSDLFTDVTALVENGTIEPFGGREEEIARVTHILMRRTKNNPLLLGKPGVGKTAIVHGLAELILKKQVPPGLQGKRILALDLASLLSGTSHRGELEKRLRDLVRDLERQGSESILFIDEVHMLIQANGAEGALNVSDILKPALARGELQVIGATTWSEYEKYLRPDAALDRRFQPVLVDEPTPAAALAMLKIARPAYEKFHGVTISDEALEAAVKLSKKIRDRYLPDKAIDLMDEAAAKVAIEALTPSHGAHLDVVNRASQNKKNHKHPHVSAADIAEVVEQWTEHARAIALEG
jgi:ATP-dependent Clp protease ATP-binding subunit ClpA